MRVIKIPKRSSGFRTIYCPSRDEKALLRSVKSQIERRVLQSGPNSDVIHGAVRRRSPVTNAMSHVRHAFTLVADLKDFFDSVTAQRLKGKLSKELMNLVLVDGAARQGLPTSPAVANLAAIDVDKAILKMFEKRGIEAVYTRYFDDLSISFDDEAAIPILLSELKNIVTRSGFKLAEHKTHLYRASAGRRLITGVAVDDHGVHPTREMKRRLRAAKHQGNKPQIAGLSEWCKLKMPHQKAAAFLESDDVIQQAKAVAAAWNLNSISPGKIPDKGPDIDIGEKCIITGDPVLMLGMSTYTVGWKSCMAQPHGTNRRGAIFWMHLEGTRIGAYFSEKTGEHGGVTRALMKARALVHCLEDGTLIHDRIFCSDAADAAHLEAQFKAHGIIFIKNASETHGGMKVVGEAPKSWKAYFDNLANSTHKAKSGKWRGKEVRTCHVKGSRGVKSVNGAQRPVAWRVGQNEPF